MSNFTQLRVYNEARKNIATIADICEHTQGFGDLKNQIKRSAISVASNIAEGSGSGSNKQFIKFLNIARASNNELLAQIQIICDLNPNQNPETVSNSIIYVGKMLSKLIKYLNTA